MRSVGALNASHATARDALLRTAMPVLILTRFARV
jgi:hypothetical protein